MPNPTTSPAGDDEAGFAVVPSPPTVRLASPRDVLDAIPHALGFRPRDSLVVVLLRPSNPAGDPRRRRTVLTARIDLLGPHVKQADDVDWQSVTAAVASSGATSSLMVMFVDRVPAGAGIDAVDDVELAGLRAWVRLGCALDEQGDLLRRAGEVLTNAGAPMDDVLAVVDERYFSLMCEDDECCPRSGTPYDVGDPGPAGLRIAVEAGSSPLPDRGSLDECFARDEHAATCILEIVERLEAVTIESAVAPQARQGSIRGVVEAAARFASHRVPDLGQAGWVLALLRNVHVRDGVIARVLDADSDGSVVHEQELRDYVTWLTRCAPDEYRAAPATMAAILWWIEGDGASANIALACAQSDDPAYRLARLMVDVVRAAIPPVQVRELLARAG